MKHFFTFTVIVLILYVSPTNGQSFTFNPELQAVCDQLVQTLNNKDYAGNLIVFDFTDQANKPTELGAFFAEEFSNYLVNSSGKFTIVDRGSIDPAAKKSSVLSKFTNVVAEEASNYLNEDDAKLVTSANKGVKTFFNPSPKDKRLKNVDAIAYGTITPVGEYYRLNIKVKDKKTDALIATTGGDVSNTEALTRLNESTLQTPEATSQPAANGSYDTPIVTNSEHIFRKDQLLFELIDCKESGRYVECQLRITSEGKDSELEMYLSETKVFNQNGGLEHSPITISIADAISRYNNVSKNLIKDTPVTSILTFEPSEEVKVISKLVLKYTMDNKVSYVLDMKDIFVE